MNSFQSLGSLINHLERSPQWQQQAQFQRIVQLWPQVVGPMVGQHSRPTGLQQGVLQVAVSSAPWAQTLTLERRTLLRRLEEHLPSPCPIQDLRFSPGRWQQTPAARPWEPLPESAPAPLSSRPPTAIAAFQHWADRVRSCQAQQFPCPQCHRPTPAWELERWGRCAPCATAPWHHGSAGHYTGIAPQPWTGP